MIHCRLDNAKSGRLRGSKIWMDNNFQDHGRLRIPNVEKSKNHRIGKFGNSASPSVWRPKYNACIMYERNRRLLATRVKNRVETFLFHPFAAADTNFIYALLVSGAIESAREPRPTAKWRVRINEQNDVLQVVRAASPVLLRVIVLGAFFIYSTVSTISVTSRVSPTGVFSYSWDLCISVACIGGAGVTPRRTVRVR